MSETTPRFVDASFKMHTQPEWDRYRPVIERLYKVEEKSLTEVVSILHKQYGFQATQRQYKTRMKLWGMRKNYKGGEVEELLRSYSRDELQSTVQDGRDPPLTVEGKRLSVSMVKRVLRQRSRSETSTTCTPSSSTCSRPEHFPSPLLSLVDAPPSFPQRPPIAPSEQPLIEQSEKPSKADFTLPSNFPSQASSPSALNCSRAHQDSHLSRSLGFSSTHSPPSYVELATSNKSSYENDESEGEDCRKRRKLSVKRSSSSFEAKLACPFYKRSPGRYNPQSGDVESSIRYRTCAGPGWESISRLRQHLIRAHFGPRDGGTDRSRLNFRNDIDKHSQNSGGSMEKQVLSDLEKISDDQLFQIKEKQLPDLTRENSWMRMYKILFPNERKTPSPYYQKDDERLTDDLASPSSPQVESLIRHLRENLPHRLMTVWQGDPKLQARPFVSTILGGQIKAIPSTYQQSFTPSSDLLVETKTIDQLPPPSTQQIKKVISETVAETCDEWLMNSKEEEADSEREESDIENELTSFTATSSSADALPAVASHTIPDFWDWNSEAQRDQTLAIYPDLSILPSNLFHSTSFQTSSFQTPVPPSYHFYPSSYTDGAVLNSRQDSYFNITAVGPCDFDLASWPSGVDVPPVGPGPGLTDAPSSNFQWPTSTLYENPSSFMPPSYSNDFGEWEFVPLPLPESDQQP